MADGLVEFDVRANLDNLQKDMDSAQDTAKRAAISLLTLPVSLLKLSARQR